MIGVLMALALAAQVPEFKLPADATARSAGPQNLDFEAGEDRGAPAQWSVAQDSRIVGYSAEVRKEGCHSGAGCAAIVAGPQVEHAAWGTLVQAFDGTPYRGKTMWLRAWVRLEGAHRGERIRVLFTVDGEKRSAEFVQKGDVRSGEWTLAEVKGKVAKDATEIHIAVEMWGKGTAWVDDVTFEVE
jgi:hypothetical protein